MLILVEGTDKNQLQPGQESMWDATVLSYCSTKSLTKTDRCAGELSRRRNQLFVLHLWGRFLLTASLKLTRALMLQFVIHSSNSFKLYHRIPETFQASMCSSAVYGCPFRTWRHFNNPLIFWSVYRSYSSEPLHVNSNTETNTRYSRVGTCHGLVWRVASDVSKDRIAFIPRPVDCLALMMKAILEQQHGVTRSAVRTCTPASYTKSTSQCRSAMCTEWWAVNTG